MHVGNSIHQCSIIIVNWNGEQFLKDCFTALRGQTFTDFEIIFIDNASEDASFPLARHLISELNLDGRCVALDRNTGFAAGNNKGLTYASGRYIVLLNTDTVAEKDWLANLMEAMETHPDVGICASKLIVAGENVIDSAGDGFSTFGHAFKRGEGSSPDCFAEQEYVLGACAGAAIYRREMLQQIGFFDEDFFLIFEDTDLNLRAQLNGWKCLYVPDAIVFHKVGGSMKKISHRTSFYAVRNDKIVKIKNLPFPVVLKQLPFLILGELIWFFYYMINGRFMYYLKANIDVLKALPVCMKKRREVMNLKKVPCKQINNLLTSGFRLYGFKRIRRYWAL